MSLEKGLYQHYKGQYYEVIDVALHTETLEELVVYRALYGEHGLWVRPLKMFLEFIEIDNVQKRRFQLVPDHSRSM
jgi:hypothetical protein